MEYTAQFFLLLPLAVVLSSFISLAAPSISASKRVSHDENCFTQGLVFHGETLYETCGLYGKSSVRIVDANTGQILARKPVQKRFFAEGVVVHNEKLYMLTWRRKAVFIYSTKTLESVGNMSFRTWNGEGWGITSDGSYFIASDGSQVLTYFDLPAEGDKKLNVAKHLNVADGVTGAPVTQMNELEYVDGFIYANLWYQDTIVKIDPASGRVVQRYDLSGLYPRSQRSRTADCLNGIAYDARDGTFLVTGKLWPYYYKVDLLQRPVDKGPRPVAVGTGARRASAEVVEDHDDVVHDGSEVVSGAERVLVVEGGSIAAASEGTTGAHQHTPSKLAHDL
jgi:glutamine cyclotransferase